MTKSEDHIKNTVQMPLGHWLFWSIGHFSRKPVSVFGLPLDKEIPPPSIKFEPPLTQLWVISLCPALNPREKRSALPSPLSPEDGQFVKYHVDNLSTKMLSLSRDGKMAPIFSTSLFQDKGGVRGYMWKYQQGKRDRDVEAGKKQMWTRGLCSNATLLSVSCVLKFS